MKSLRALLIFSVAMACQNDPKPAPAAAFSFNVGQNGTVTFVNESLNATTFDWDFGDGTFSTVKDPIRAYTDNKTFSVRLTSTGDGGSATVRKDVMVSNVTGKVTFSNNLRSGITIMADSQTKTIAPGSTASFTGLAGAPLLYSGSTFGTRDAGIQVGFKINFNGTETFKAAGAPVSFVVPSEYFFLRFSNNTGKNLANLTMNIGLVSQLNEPDVVVPSDGIPHNIGYFQVVPNANVLIGVQNSTTVIFMGVTFPGGVNQEVTLSL